MPERANADTCSLIPPHKEAIILVQTGSRVKVVAERLRLISAPTERGATRCANMA
jgi:hypothetical protein